MHTKVVGSEQTNILSSTIMGVELLRSGILVFQTIFFSADHSVGGVASGYLPVPSVRQPTICCAITLEQANRHRSAIPSNLIFIFSLLVNIYVFMDLEKQAPLAISDYF
jgi:hypothetical protein